MERFNPLPIGEIRPAGWLKSQLEIQLRALSGNLDLIWPDVRDSAWFGGNRDGWERAPYWLDGAIPLAWLTDDAPLQERIRAHIDAVLSHQKPDGWLCPCADDARKNYDVWAVFLTCKMLTVYHSCTGDQRIEGAVYAAMKNCHEFLAENPLADWGQARWFEAFIALNWLYERRPEAWILDLARLLKEQGLDYTAVTNEWKTPLNRWVHQMHVVNVAMCLKCEAVSHALLGEDYRDIAESLLKVLMRYNGTPVGTFTGDECLSGLSPIQGTELCAVVEQAYSYECLLAESGDPKWADRLEQVVYNALPATFTDDMWAHQYDQMLNQVECVAFEGKPIFRTNGQQAHTFGLEPHFGCCTANFSQGWPKFAASAFMKCEGGLVNTVLAPCAVRTRVNGVPVEISLETQYPFRTTATYRVRAAAPVQFRLGLRVPAWARRFRVNGAAVKARGIHWIEKTWAGETEISVSFAQDLHLSRHPHELYTLHYGPLAFALPLPAQWNRIEYERGGVERKYPYCDYEVRRRGPFGYAFARTDFRLEELPVTDMPFGENSPPLRVIATMQPIRWGYEDGYNTVCARVPDLHVTGKERQLALQPYGSTRLRITEIPMTLRP